MVVYVDLDVHVYVNGILMLDSEQHFSGQGTPIREAIFQAGRRRLRPLLMTALATILGILPLALGVGSGAQLLQPLAIAVIGGVTVSMVLSLVITPCFSSCCANQESDLQNLLIYGNLISAGRINASARAGAGYRGSHGCSHQ